MGVNLDWWDGVKFSKFFQYTIDDFERMAMKTDYAVEANEDTCKINEADEGAFYKEGFKAGASFILHQNRWRKVEEELPDNQDIVLVKTDKGRFATAYLHGKESGFIVYGDEAYREFGKITHWKPIT